MQNNQSAERGLNNKEHLGQKYTSRNTQNPCPRMMGFDHDAVLRPIFCGSWKCPVCRRRNAAHWAMRVKFGMNEIGRPIAFFWTMTMPGTVLSPVMAYEKIPGMWDSLRKSVQRSVYPRAFMYCAFVEGQPHRQDMPHFHIITFNSWPGNWKRFKDFACHFGFGHQSVSDVVTSGEAASYVAKYASKDAQSMPRNFRRVRISQEWPEQEFLPYFVKANTETTLTFLTRVSEDLRAPIQTLYDRWQEEGVLLSALREQTEVLKLIDICVHALDGIDNEE